MQSGSCLPAFVWTVHHRRSTRCLLGFLLAGVLSASAQVSWTPQAPPTPPPVAVRTSPVPGPLGGHGPKDSLTRYSIGEPTADEQAYLEFINRARANPPAEGVRLATTTDPNILAAYNYFNVDTNLLVSQFNVITPAPPLAFNSNLIASARSHSAWMLANAIQCHYEDIAFGCPSGVGTNSPGYRAGLFGYAYQMVGENIYATSLSDWYGHAGFNVDWGYGTGGMQTPPGHRENIMDPGFHEVGIGVLYGSNGGVGPQLVTQDFGVQFSPPPLVTGVAYYDLNGNQFYDPGEGLGGVTVNVDGSAYYAITSDSGGFAVPSANGTHTVTFSGPGLPTVQQVVTIANGDNVKVDYPPAYQPPVISGPAQPAVGVANPYTFTAVGGADAYEWRSAFSTSYTNIEGAEAGLTNVTLNVSPGYSILDSAVKQSGSYSFHLAQPDYKPQYLTLAPTFRTRANAAIYFYSRLGYATSDQTARLQISTNGGAAWFDLWAQSGSGGAGDSGFTRRTNSLAAYPNQEILVRFVYDFPAAGGSAFTQTNDSPPFGLYLDNIAFTNVERLVSVTTNAIGGTGFDLTPATPGTYSLRVAPHISSRYLAFGPELVVTAVTAPILRVNQITRTAPPQVRIDFGATNLTAATFLLYRADAVTGPWVQDTGAVLTTNTPGALYSFTTSSTSAARYYRVRTP